MFRLTTGRRSPDGEIQSDLVLWSWLKYSRLNNFAPRDSTELDARVIAELMAVRDDQAFLRSLFHASELPILLTLLS